jgi:hypothetical protein
VQVFLCSLPRELAPKVVGGLQSTLGAGLCSIAASLLVKYCFQFAASWYSIHQCASSAIEERLLTGNLTAGAFSTDNRYYAVFDE